MKNTFWGKMGVIVAVIAVLCTWLPQQTANASSQLDHVSARAAYAIDAESGQVLYQQNQNQEVPIASLTKLMTLYLVERDVQSGKLNWSDNVPIDKELQKMSKNSETGSVEMKTNEKFTVKQLFDAALIASSNSAAIALGNKVGGSNARFIQMMNEQAKRWHIDAKFVSSSGLDNTDLTKYHYDLKGTDKKAQNLVSASAITIISQHLINEFPDVLKVAKTTNEKVNGTAVMTSNELLPGQPYYDEDLKVDGLKTGYTPKALMCYTTTYTVDGHRIIATVLGAKSSFPTMIKLMKNLKETYTYEQITPRPVALRTPDSNRLLSAPSVSTTTGLWISDDTNLEDLTGTVTATTPLNGMIPTGNLVARKQVTDKNLGLKETVEYCTNTPYYPISYEIWHRNSDFQPINASLAQQSAFRG
ncbi:D-alanyl-D-alanine carboxypeptidase family protein [Levilactobacillus bambusae]|uniref:D-alanyl-D-alanine carboxypeptidase n=1 Tax=Levilactobacillus bambusae TaxID=2024736 RepID=A0A2V1MZK7_9LACO|nr:serine hydrolase [Levilactobacillus bambusae]PWG00252.1 D-alanyl-D-alanine carboxypeptidase [Levilactobacillus bambusae]